MAHTYQSLPIAAAIYDVGGAAYKYSILCCLRRVFDVRPFRRFTLGFFVLVTAMFIVSVPISLWICVPMRAFWDRTIPGTCLNFDKAFLAIETIETILDGFLLALPIYMINNLQLSKRNKIILSMIFLMGGVVVLTGILRIALTYRPNQEYVSFTNVVLWTHLHLATAIICACLPTYRPLIRKAGGFTTSLHKRYGPLVHKSWTRSKKTTGNDMTYMAQHTADYSVNRNMDPHGDRVHLTALPKVVHGSIDTEESWKTYSSDTRHVV